MVVNLRKKRGEKMNWFKKTWKIICWPWNKFLKWLSKGLPKK